MTAELKVEGLRELQNQMKALGGKTARRLRGNALRAGARAALKAVQSAAPVRSKPGGIKRGTGTSKKKEGGAVFSRVSFPGNLKRSIKLTRLKQSDTDAWVAIKSDFYGRFQEYGTINKNKLKARKFAERAVNSVAPQMLKKISDNAAKGVKRELKKRG